MSLRRSILSLWILFHLFAILVLPNISSYIGRRTTPWITNYGGVLGLNLSWNFFSPDPAHTMYFKFTLYTKEQLDSLDESNEPQVVFLPSTKDSPNWTQAERRSMYSMRFMMLDPSRVDTVVGPWLCRTYPKSELVRVEFEINSIPPLDLVREEDEVNSFVEKIRAFKKEYNCPTILKGGVDG